MYSRGQGRAQAAGTIWGEQVCDLSHVGMERTGRSAAELGEGAEAQVGHDLLDDLGLLNKGDNPNGPVTAQADERIDLVHLLDEARSGALRDGWG